MKTTKHELLSKWVNYYQTDADTYLTVVTISTDFKQGMGMQANMGAVRMLLACSWCLNHVLHAHYPLSSFLLPTALSDGTVLTELELVPALLMRNKVEQLLAGGNVSFLGSSSKTTYRNLVGRELSQVANKRNVFRF